MPLLIFYKELIRKTMTTQKHYYTTEENEMKYYSDNTVLNKLEELFPSKIMLAVFLERPSRQLAQTISESHFSSGEKIIAEFLIHLYNPSFTEWSFTNLIKLDDNNRKKVLFVLENLNEYCL